MRADQVRPARPNRKAAIALGAAAALGGSALFNRWSAARARRRYPPIGTFVEVEGTRLHYLDRGDGPPVVLLHGSGSLIADFVTSGLVDRLARDHRVIAFDRPGYGYSSRPRGKSWGPERQAEVMRKACARIGVERPILVGHSYGTLPALAWAGQDPDGIAALVLISGYYYGTPRPDMVPNGLLAAPLLGDALVNTVAPLQARITGPAGLKMIFSPADTPQRFKDDMPFELMLRPGQLRATAADSGGMPLVVDRLRARLEPARFPISIIWGEGDKLVGQRGQSERLAASLPAARAHRVADGGHMLHHLVPDRVANWISASVVPA